MTTARQHVLRVVFMLALAGVWLLPPILSIPVWTALVFMGVFAFGWWVGFEEGA